MLSHLPVLGICGFSNSGKTTLLERIIPELVRKNLKVAVVKHDAHRIDVDRPGKDSDRLFKAGADVLLHGDERFCRCHSQAADNLEGTLASLCRDYDLVLVEGNKRSKVPKIWLSDTAGTPPPAELSSLLDCYGWHEDRVQRLLLFLEEWLKKKIAEKPLFGLILLGGQNRRMGEAKQMLLINGRTWLEQIAAAMQPFVRHLVVAGNGQVPISLSGLTRLPDCLDCQGPLTGMLSALRWQPEAAWLTVACDMPLVSTAAIKWLIDQRTPGIWGIVPQLAPKLPEPLFALYDGRLLGMMEDIAGRQEPRPALVAAHPKVFSPLVPEELQPAWTNINSHAELDACTALRHG